ncbi:hypothetical protein [Streptomyces sp. NPDC051219]|uniref:hypothetical protein n=1 Tax=Streptomyces sp. NPDC051219 TaxID=3155283 RepID=UPI0034339C37
MAGLAPVVTAIMRSGGRGWSCPVLVLLGAGLALLWVFVRVEIRRSVSQCADWPRIFHRSEAGSS